MRIAWLEPASPTTQGDQIYRTIQPARALAQDPSTQVIAGSFMHPIMHQAASEADILVLCQAIDPDFLPLLAKRQERGQATVMEINDNFLEPQRFGDVDAFYHHPAQRALAMQLAQKADGLLLGTPYLKGLFGHLNANQLIVPNGIDTLPPPRMLQAQPHPIRLGWAGSEGHRIDLLALMPVLVDAMTRHANLRLCIMAPKALHALFAWVPPNRLDLRDAGSLNDYLAFIATWDIGLAPLSDTPFNRGRSDVKFLEYAQNCVPVIASKGPAYSAIIHGKTGLLAAALGDFAEHITQCIENPTLRHTLAHHAYSYVAKHRRLSAIGKILGPFLARCQRAEPAPQSHPSAWLHTLTQDADAYLAPRMAYLPYGPLQKHLFLGLLPQSDTATAQTHLQQAAKLAPGFYLPQLYAGTRAHKSRQLDYLLAARKLAPQSLAVGHQLAIHAFNNKDYAQVLAYCTAPEGTLGDYAPTYEWVAEAYGALNEPCLQRHMLMRALKANPWYRAPAARLAELTLGLIAPHNAKSLSATSDMALQTVAIDALQESIWRLPGSWQDAYLLGELFQMQNALAKARDHMEQALAWSQTPTGQQGIGACTSRLAQICLKMGDMRAAGEYLQRAKQALKA
jgi:tetratricopeptide (TPR) repeat protein